MKVAVVGLRGFPQVQGGVEKHVESITPLLVSLGCDVTVYVRARYMQHISDNIWKNVKFYRIYSPDSKVAETFVHTFFSVLAASWHGAEIIHFHAIGPSFFIPLAKFLGMKVVMTHHGQDYLRQKWGKTAKIYLKVSEYLGIHFADHVIVISKQLQMFVAEKYQQESVLIPNGVPHSFHHIENKDVLTNSNVVRGKYLLHVGRLVPEKKHHDLIDAFLKLQYSKELKLVFAGSADHDDIYSKSVVSRATKDIIFLGEKTSEELAVLYANCIVFILPSSHEGLPIALLEALSFGCPVIVSNIEAHKELNLPQKSYFSLGEVDDLCEKIKFFIENPTRWEDWSKKIASEYDWNVIAQKIYNLYLT